MYIYIYILFFLPCKVRIGMIVFYSFGVFKQVVGNPPPPPPNKPRLLGASEGAMAMATETFAYVVVKDFVATGPASALG